jgi:hypothetical protein
MVVVFIYYFFDKIWSKHRLCQLNQIIEIKDYQDVNTFIKYTFSFSIIFGYSFKLYDYTIERCADGSYFEKHLNNIKPIKHIRLYIWENKDYINMAIKENKRHELDKIQLKNESNKLKLYKTQLKNKTNKFEKEIKSAGLKT